jgi:hypothetical protein
VDGSFEQLDTTDFIEAGEYSICWKTSFIEYEGYIRASDSFWIVIDKPQIVSESNLSINLNEVTTIIRINGTFTYFDEFEMFTGSPECTAGNEFGSLFRYSHYQIGSWIKETA